MPSLTLTNITDELTDEFREVAWQERQNITRQVPHMLEQAIARRETAKRGAQHELKSAGGSEET